MYDESRAANSTDLLERRRRGDVDGVSARFAQRDPRAVDEVYAHHASNLHATAYRLLGDRDLASEAVQRAMLRAWQNAHTFDAQRPLGPWLHAICRRTAIDTHRSHRRHPQPIEADELSRRLPVSADGPVDVTVAAEVRRAIDSLPDGEADVVRLAFLGGLSHEEVADALGIPVGTVKSRSHRAHRRLAAKLAHLRDRHD
jgi:RNA polymerase sigma-70 factor (ECF subfamily)